MTLLKTKCNLWLDLEECNKSIINILNFVFLKVRENISSFLIQAGYTILEAKYKIFIFLFLQRKGNCLNFFITIFFKLISRKIKICEKKTENVIGLKIII